MSRLAMSKAEARNTRMGNPVEARQMKAPSAGFAAAS
jgi:hypothetical protein